MSVREITLADLGLETCGRAAARRGCDPATVRRWVSLGWIPAAVVGSGRTAVYLVRVSDVDRFTPPPVFGRAAGGKSAPKKPAKRRGK